MTIRMPLKDLLHCWIGQVIVVVMRDHDCVDNGYVFDFTRHFRVALWAHERARGTAVLKDRIEKNS